MGIYALGRLQFGDLFANHEPAVASVLLEAYIFLQRQKELKNLGLQESRLRRQYEKDAAELAQLQKQRAARLAAPQSLTAGRTLVAENASVAENDSCSSAPESLATVPTAENGFEFSPSPDSNHPAPSGV